LLISLVFLLVSDTPQDDTQHFDFVEIRVSTIQRHFGRDTANEFNESFSYVTSKID